MRWLYAIIIVTLCIVRTSNAAPPAQITAITFDETQIVVTLSQKPRYTAFTLDNPHRAVIDFENTRLHARTGRLRSGKRPQQGLRLVADLKNPVRLNTTLRNTNGKWQLIVELRDKNAPPVKKMDDQEEIPSIEDEIEINQPAPITNKNPPARLREPAPFNKGGKNTPEDEIETVFQKAAAAPLSKNPPQKKGDTFRPPSSRALREAPLQTNTDTPKATESEKISGDEDVLHEEIFPEHDKRKLPSRYLAKRDVIIVIDAGHGGKDPGAVGPNGAREKDVTLAIARRLQTLLNQEPGIRAILTRSTDNFIRLRERLKVARTHKADVFVSIHADAFKTAQASGVSVFALSPSGASSEAARWLAEKENTSELGEVNLDDKGAALRSVLLDLSQTATISLSVQLGSHVLTQLGKVTQVRHPDVEQARFVVLKSPDIPSILVETGFISNSEEARRLADPVHQNRLALALKTGLHKHFVQYPPPGTLVALARNK